jgi:hypothetical protein
VTTLARRARTWLECFEKFRIRPIDHAPYSPDLAPSDFYLFGKLKGAFAGRELASTEELLLAMKDVTRSIERDELESVFNAWERRLIQCIEEQGEYVNCGESKNHRRKPVSHSQSRMLKNNRTPYISTVSSA